MRRRLKLFVREWLCVHRIHLRNPDAWAWRRACTGCGMASMGSQTEINPRRDGADAVVHASPVMGSEHREDLLTRMVEHQAAKIPANVFRFSAFCAMAMSLL